MLDRRDSNWRRGRKAVISAMQENEVEKPDNGLKRNFDLLLQAGTFQSVQRQDEKGQVHADASFTMTWSPMSM